MLTTDQLAAMTATVAASLTDTATVLRPADVIDEAGTVAHTWTPAGTYPCRVGVRTARAAGGDEPNVGGLNRAITQYKITTLPDADITATDRLTVGGRTFEVVRVPAAVTGAVELVLWAVEVA